MKISVIMPCYNHEQYVERAIISVYDQVYKDFQLIVVDDGSSDASVQVLEDLRNRLGFTLLTQRNQGVCKTLNRAIHEAADGEYIALLASDDFWHSDKLRLQIDALSKNPESEFCFSQAFEFNDENHGESKYFKDLKEFMEENSKNMFFITDIILLNLIKIFHSIKNGTGNC